MSFPGHWRHFLHDRDGYTQSLVAVSDWSNHHLPSGATLLIHDAGYISYATRFRLVDFVGLKTPSSIAFNRTYTYGTCGIGRALAVAEIARMAKPEYLVMVKDWDRGFRITEGLTALGWHLDELSKGESYDDSYSLYRLTPPTADHLVGKR